MLTTLLVALLAAIPATLAAMAAWRGSRLAVEQTNGHIGGPLARIEIQLDDVIRWQITHERQHATEVS